MAGCEHARAPVADEKRGPTMAREQLSHVERPIPDDDSSDTPPRQPRGALASLDVVAGRDRDRRRSSCSSSGVRFVALLHDRARQRAEPDGFRSTDQPRIEIDGATAYPTDDEIMLLFVRESARVQRVGVVRSASIDPDIDLFKEQQFTGGLDPEEVRVESDADMARSQIAAKKVALEAAGYTVPSGEGVAVLAVQPSRPAADVLDAGDVILAVDGEALEQPDDLSEAIRAHEVGESVELDGTAGRQGRTGAR